MLDIWLSRSLLVADGSLAVGLRVVLTVALGAVGRLDHGRLKETGDQNRRNQRTKGESDLEKSTEISEVGQDVILFSLIAPLSVVGS